MGSMTVTLKMSKTIKKIADELGVSKQAVYKRFKGRLYTAVAPYTHTDAGILYIEEQGETFIKQDFAGNTASDGAHTDTHTGSHTDTVVDAVIEMLKKELDEKNEQLRNLEKELAVERQHGREQADKIAALADQAQRLQLAQMKPVELIGVGDPTETEPAQKKKWQFWKR